MRHTTISGELERALGEYVHAAARLLQADVVAGAEVELELGAQRGRAHTPFYTCRPLTGRFIREREPSLARLPEHEAALRALRDFDGLERYLAGRRPDEARRGVRARDLRAGVDARGVDARGGDAREALSALLEDVFAERTDFDLSMTGQRPERLTAALGRLESAELANMPGSLTLVASLHGMAISSPELRLTHGLTIAMPTTLRWAPVQALAVDEDGAGHVLVALTCEEPVDGRAILRDLLRALRLFGDGRVTLGPLAWARIDGQDAWSAVPLGMGGRPHGMLVVAAEQEDELRAFCNLVSRRAPDANELAWALRRFELGCERSDPYEGLSDHLLALRALLARPEGPIAAGEDGDDGDDGDDGGDGGEDGLLARRVAALCATPERRERLIERMAKAQRLERAAIAGTASASSAGIALAGEVANHLRALLRDVICGHLPVDLARLADELLAAPDMGEDTSPAPDAAGDTVATPGMPEAGEDADAGAHRAAPVPAQQILVEA